MKLVLLSGYFDPLHVGHIEMIEKAHKLGDYVIVIVNNRDQALLKKGYEFMPFVERMKILRSLRCVDMVFLSRDTDLTVRESLRYVVENAVKPGLLITNKEFVFANGGDRHQGEYPEAEVCRKLGIEMVDGLGKKIQSSSSLVEKARKHNDKVHHR